jgi:hypothetical protein
MAKPIPRRLLPHTATQFYNQVDDGLGHKSGPSRSLNHIRIEPGGKLVITKDNMQHEQLAVLIFDCRNSEPAGATFDEGDLIVCDGGTFTILSVDLLQDNRRTPHHWELGIG